MAFIKSLKFINGFPKEINVESDSLVAYSIKVGGSISGTELTKAILDVLTGGSSSDAGTLHMHDGRYYRKDQTLDASAGAGSAGAPMKLDSRGKIDPTFYAQSDLDHGSISGLADDDHPQYLNTARGDARYFQKTEFIATSAGAGDAGKPIKTNASGKVDASFIDSASSNHEQLSGLLGGTTNEHYHLTSAQHSTLTSGADASSLHNHNTQYYTKAQIDASLALKADDADVIKHDGSVAFTSAQSMGSNKLTNLADGTSGSDAVNKAQMDAADALKVSKAGDTMSGVLNMGDFNVTNVADPINPQDAANKRYVDALSVGQRTKEAVRLATVADIDIALIGLAVIDGVQTVDGDRVLVKDQTLGQENGIYVAHSGAWTRATDFNDASEAVAGVSTFVNEGTVNGNLTFTLFTDAPYTIGTTPLDFTETSRLGQIVAGVGLSKTGEELSVNLGAGIKELPTDEIGLDLHVNSALDLVDPSTGDPSAADDAQLSLKLDGATLAKGASGVRVADAGITPTQLDTSVAGAGLVGGAGTALAVNPGDGIEVTGDAVKAKVADFAGDGLEDDGSNNLRLKASVAGAGLAHASGVLSVNVDDSTLEISGDALRQKDLGTTRAKLALDAVGENQIDFGLGAQQVSAEDMPLRDTAGKFTTDDVESALAELATAGMVETFTSGEAIGTNDLVAVRRDGGPATKLYKASAAAADNYVAATLAQEDITYTALVPSGNDIRVRYVNPAMVSAALAVSVSGRDISVSLATDGTGALISTATEIQAAVAAHSGANQLVSAAVTGTGGDIQSAFAYTNLSGGMDFNDNGRWEVIGMAMEAAVGAGSAVRVKKIGKLACSFISAIAASDIGKAVYLSINRGAATMVAPTATDSAIVYLGRVVSATEFEFRAPTLRGVNG